MSIEEAGKDLTCHGIRLTATAIMRVDGGRVFSFISRDRIQELVLGRGCQAARPWTQRVLGLIVIAISLVPVYHLVSFLAVGGTFYFREGFIAALSVLGVWLIYDSFRTGYYLDVRMRLGRERLPFTRKASEVDLQTFVNEAPGRFGYFIHWT